MKVCYVDESGDASSDSYFVMVGILTDAVRLNKTSREFAQKFREIASLFPEDLKELKSSRILYGKGGWRQVDAEERKHIFLDFCSWIVERKHDLLVSAIDQKNFRAADSKSLPDCCKDMWLAAALNIALQVQIKNQSLSGNKGHTFLFYDDNKLKVGTLCELLWSPPSWCDAYYGRGRKQAALDQIIDTAFAIKSHHSGVVQVADIFAFIFRRFFEIGEGEKSQQWDGELDLIKRCLALMKDRIHGNASGMKSANKCAAANWYRAIAPTTYAGLLKGQLL